MRFLRVLRILREPEFPVQWQSTVMAGKYLSDEAWKRMNAALRKLGPAPSEKQLGDTMGVAPNTAGRIFYQEGGSQSRILKAVFRTLGIDFFPSDLIDTPPASAQKRGEPSPVVEPQSVSTKLVHAPTKYFVERAGFLERLRAALKSGDAALTQGAALQGMGGVGKTQTALKFCEVFAADFPGGVFWLRSDSEDNLIADCQLSAGVTCPEVLVDGQPKASALKFCAELSSAGAFSRSSITSIRRKPSLSSALRWAVRARFS